MATHEELIAANLTVAQICERIGADSLGYLSKEGLLAATARKRGEMCLGCFTGEYPETYNGPPFYERPARPSELSTTR